MRAAALWLVAMPVLLFAAANVIAQAPDPVRGQALYENHCQVCHTSKVHARAKRIPMTRADVREIVGKWQVQQRLTWSAQDVGDVVEFLNRTQYHFN